MKDVSVVWHPYPQEDLPENGRYFFTIRGIDGNYVRIFRISNKEDFKNKYTLAWAELPEKYDKRRKKDASVNWHTYPEEKPDEFGEYLSTVKSKKKRYISTSYWFNDTREFFHEDKEKVLAWVEMPEPYKEEL